MFIKMYTNQLENCLQSDPVICKQYGGVWALDQLPKFIDPLPRIYVINTQESTNTHSGHWVCIFSEGGQFDFFDSYARILTFTVPCCVISCKILKEIPE